jgi:ubiquinone biosynthesis protein COQ9
MARARTRAEADRIVDAVVEAAATVGWARVRLHGVADGIGLPLAKVRRHYADLDAVADAWLGRADMAMMLCGDEPAYRALPVCERLEAAILRWLDTLAGYRQVTGDMLRAKLYPGHPHHGAALAVRLSRTVQWLREAARLEATGRRRQVEEIGLSALMVATVADWMRDDSPLQAMTRRRLRRRLASADRLMRAFGG